MTHKEKPEVTSVRYGLAAQHFPEKMAAVDIDVMVDPEFLIRSQADMER